MACSIFGLGAQRYCKMIIKAFKMAGITPIAEIEIPDEDPFENI